MQPITRISTNFFHVTDENKFREIMNNVRIRDDNELSISSGENLFSFTANDVILGYAIGSKDDPDYDYDAFIHDLQNVIPDNEAIIIYTVTFEKYPSNEYDVITNKKWVCNNMQAQALEEANKLLSDNDSNEIYLLDVGVLTNIGFDNGAYSTVYDKKHGYYDENQSYSIGINDTKEAAIEYVANGVDGTYAVVSKTNLSLDDFYPDLDSNRDVSELDVTDEKYDVDSIVYSVAKINGKIVENFIEKPEPNTSNLSFEEKVVQYCLDNGTGIRYTQMNEDGRPNLTTEKEKAEKPFNNSIRYVDPAAVEYYTSPEIRSKTEYILQLRELGSKEETCLLAFDEWIAICNIFNCPEMTLHDASAITDILWKYGITPLEFDDKACRKITTESSAIDDTSAPNSERENRNE